MPDIVIVNTTIEAFGNPEFSLSLNGTVIGTLDTWVRDGVAQVCMVRVDAAHQGKGLSQRLYEALLGWCREAGVQTVEGDVIHPAAERVRSRVFGDPILREDTTTKMVDSSRADEDYIYFIEVPAVRLVHQVN